MARRSDPTVPSSLASRGLEPGAGALLLVTGQGHLSTHALDGRTITIGRDEAADIALDHAKISRQHAVIRGSDPPTVEDAGSTNGVRIGGRRLATGERAPLTPGTSFQVGPFHALVVAVGASVGASAEGRAALIVRDPRAGLASDVVQRVAASDVSILIRGETGVGKEVLARALHDRSGRSGPLVGLNCASLSESLLESELFGHERGAFTGAVATKPGLFEAASGGTVFLDEVGDLPLAAQVKLLRAIETRQVLRVGGLRPIELDVRFLAATHRDLAADVARGAFRQDLYFRLNGLTLVVPPLRERKEAVPLLAQEFLTEAATRAKRKTVPRLAAAAVAALARHAWPGNVRELKAVIERAALLSGGDEITARHIVLDAPAPAPAPAPPAAQGSPEDSAERDRIVAALEQCSGNQTRAAKVLGISRATLVHKLDVHRIPRPRR
jgi:DNA-binding NtrC family response regulator